MNNLVFMRLRHLIAKYIIIVAIGIWLVGGYLFGLTIIPALIRYFVGCSVFFITVLLFWLVDKNTLKKALTGEENG